MTSKTKFGLTTSALIFIAFMLILAISAVSVYGMSKMNNFSFSFRATKINGFIEANYSYAGKSINMTTDGAEDGDTILNYNGETKSYSKQLKLVGNDTIVLSKLNNYVVFEYCFSNTNETSPYSLYVNYVDTQKTDKNISVTWGYSENEQVTNFFSLEYISDFFADPISGLSVKPGKNYLYIKAQIIDDTKEAEFSGDFTFQMIG